MQKILWLLSLGWRGHVPHWRRHKSQPKTKDFITWNRECCFCQKILVICFRLCSWQLTQWWIYTGTPLLNIHYVYSCFKGSIVNRKEIDDIHNDDCKNDPKDSAVMDTSVFWFFLHVLGTFLGASHQLYELLLEKLALV